jgi:hypothetical protein
MGVVAGVPPAVCAVCSVQCAVCSVCSVCSGLRAQMQGIIKASDKTTVCLCSGGTLFG